MPPLSRLTPTLYSLLRYFSSPFHVGQDLLQGSALKSINDEYQKMWSLYFQYMPHAHFRKFQQAPLTLESIHPTTTMLDLPVSIGRLGGMIWGRKRMCWCMKIRLRPVRHICADGRPRCGVALGRSWMW